jgi:asparagine synthase (glutamine-hydrolysing)
LGKLPWDGVFNFVTPIAKANKSRSLLGRSKSVVQAWRQPSVKNLNHYWLDRYREECLPLDSSTGVTTLDFPVQSDPASTAALYDAGIYLPDDILVKVDRASMANGLECRAPLLDHRIIEFSYSLPREFKLHKGISKKILRSVLARHVPTEIIERPKMGFSIPLSGWLRNELRPWAESLLDGLETDSGHIDKSILQRMWQEHISGKRDHTARLWGAFMLLDFLDPKNKISKGN